MGITLGMGPGMCRLMWPLLLSLFYVLLHQGVAVAECPTICTADYNPVCGTDYNTYSNMCALNVKQCQRNSSLGKLFGGECACRQNVACTEEYQAHCGTDGKTYANRCYFGVAKLCSKTGLQLAKFGECGNTTGECAAACTADYNPVCGTDYNTYSNLCALNVKQCQSGSSLGKLYDGECVCRQDVACTEDYQPHCGTDGKTYDNRCYFGVAKTCSKIGLQLDKLGECGNTAGTARPIAAILVAAALTVLTITY